MKYFLDKQIDITKLSEKELAVLTPMDLSKLSSNEITQYQIVFIYDLSNNFTLYISKYGINESKYHRGLRFAMTMVSDKNHIEFLSKRLIKYHLKKD